MPFSRPTLPNLITRCQQRIYVALPGTDPMLLRSVVTAVGAVLGMELNLEYGYLDYIFEQFFVRTATGQYLDDKGAPYNLPRYPATIATGAAAAAGGTPGTPLPVGTLLQTADMTVTASVSTATAVASDGTISATMQTVVAGSAGNLPAGATLNMISAVGGIPASFTVGPGGFSGGLDTESDDDYRVRVLARIQRPPQGGAARDYISWTKNAVAGVSRCWVYPLYQGLGTVGVASVFDGRAPANSIIPTSSDMVALQAAIAAGNPAPVCADPIAFQLIQDQIPIVIGNLVPVTGFTAAQALANATLNLQALFGLSTPGGAVFGDGVTGNPTAPVSGTTFLEDISAAINSALGVGSFDLVSPAADVVSAYGHLAQLGPVTPQ
jgi:uncharacterized phage protein gp47/JayE